MDLRPETHHDPGAIEFGSPPPGALTWTRTLQHDVPEDRIVRAAFRYVLTARQCTQAQARELGRAMGAQAHGHDLRAYLDAFSHLGLGTLHAASLEQDRYVVEGHELYAAQTPRSLTCSLALGFVEGAAAALEDREALGAELRCRSRGAPFCEFHIRPRREGRALADDLSG